MRRLVLQTIVVAIVLKIVVQPVVLSVRQAISVGILVGLGSVKAPMFQSVVHTVVTAVASLSRFCSAENQSTDGNQSQCEPLHENPLCLSYLFSVCFHLREKHVSCRNH